MHDDPKYISFSTLYFIARLRRFKVPKIFVSAKILGFVIELSTCDSAAKLIT